MLNSGSRYLSTAFKPLVWQVAAAMSLALVGDSSGALRHNYLFNSGDGTTVVDSTSGANGTAFGGTFDPADSRFALDGVDDYVNLPAAQIAINTYSELTLELWSSVSTIHEGQFTASVAFGTTATDGFGQQYIMMQPSRAGAEGSSGQITAVSGGEEVRVTATPDLSDGRIHHTVLTIDSTTLAYYVDGQPIGTMPLGTTSLANVSNDFAYLGDSVWSFDPFLTGSLYEFRIYDDAKDAGEVSNLFAAGCTDACGEMYLEVDRDTGSATLINTLTAKDVIISQISSAKGALNPDNWLSITENYDAGDGGEFDDDDDWEIVTRTNTLLHEQDPLGSGAEDGGVFDSPIPLGSIWTKSPFEDLEVTLTILDENFLEQNLSVPVRFINGVDDAPFSRSDFDVDGDVDLDDYLTLQANHLKPLEGILHIDTFGLGDVNGDLLNDYRDFRLFKADFIAANGVAAFASLITGAGNVPEPGTLGLLMCGAVGVLAVRRKRSTQGVGNAIDNMTCLSKVLLLVAFLSLIPSNSRAQTIVTLESFDTRVDTTAFGIEGATTLTLVDQGGGDNALQFTATSEAGGFFAAGFTLPAWEIEPGPGGPNISPNLVDYQLSFDLTINAVDGFTPNLEIWLADGPRFSTNNANLYTAAGLVNGVNNISFTLDQNLTTTTPNGFTSPGGAWSPMADDWWLQLNSISFGAPAGAVVDYTIDNIQVTVDVAPTLALVVDPDSGKARIRNVSAGDLTLDYYRIESTNGSLLTADYNGTTGWNSLDDQGDGSLGSGVGESWNEVTEANSANQLVEQFLLGEKTVAPGQSFSIGAPVNPAILNNQIDSLAFRIGGPAFSDIAIAQVIFEEIMDLTGDYNNNGFVDAADYTIWRDRLGQDGTLLPNRDPNNEGLISQDDYDSWKANFGATAGSGSIAKIGQSTVPEPATGLVGILAIWCAAFARIPRTWRAGES